MCVRCWMECWHLRRHHRCRTACITVCGCTIVVGTCAIWLCMIGRPAWTVMDDGCVVDGWDHRYFCPVASVIKWRRTYTTGFDLFTVIACARRSPSMMRAAAAAASRTLRQTPISPAVRSIRPPRSAATKLSQPRCLLRYSAFHHSVAATGDKADLSSTDYDSTASLDGEINYHASSMFAT